MTVCAALETVDVHRHAGTGGAQNRDQVSVNPVSLLAGIANEDTHEFEPIFIIANSRATWRFNAGWINHFPMLRDCAASPSPCPARRRRHRWL